MGRTKYVPCPSALFLSVVRTQPCYTIVPVIVKVSCLLPEMPRLDLVVLDELGFLPFSKDGGQVLFQLCSDLHERVSIIITTNVRFADWNAIFGDEIMTTSLLDRLTSKGHILEFVGESYRFRQRTQVEEQAASS